MKRLFLFFSMLTLSHGAFCALNFKTVNTNYIDCGNHVGPQTGFTACSWVFSSSQAITMIIGSQFSATQGNSYFQFFNTATGVIHGRMEQALTTYIGRTTAANAWVANTWTHICMTWNGGTLASSISIYINGIKSDTTDDNSNVFATINNTAIDLQIGAQAGGTITFNGQLDDFRMYGRALSQNEIKTLYLSRSRFILNTNSTYAYIPLNDGIINTGASTVLDRGSGKFTCTTNNSPVWSLGILNYP